MFLDSKLDKKDKLFVVNEVKSGYDTVTKGRYDLYDPVLPGFCGV